MEEQPPIYRDLWKEYKMVMDKMKKPPKLFGKVSLEDIIAHLRLITHDMVEFEQFEELAQVYRSMADIFGKLGKQIDQRNFYLKAARTYFKLLKNRSEMKFSLYTDLGDSMEENYLKAIELSFKMNLIKLGALTFAEMAECFHFLKRYEFAHRYYLKSARILQTDFFLELSIFKKIIINANFYENLDEPICDLFLLWQPFVRKFPKKETEESYPVSAPEEIVRESLRRFEIDFILISLKRYLTQDELGKSILNDYDGNFRLNLRTSILNKDEYLKISEFVQAVKLRKKHEVYHIYLIFLKDVMDDLGKKLFKEIYSFLDEIRIVRDDFRKIMDDKSLSAKERIKKLYEEHTMSKRENVPSLEDDKFTMSLARNPAKAKRLKELEEKRKQSLKEKVAET